MAVIQWDNMKDDALKDIEDIFDRAMPSFAWPLARRAGWASMLSVNPRVDIVERDGNYVIEADVPGIAKEDLRVCLEQGVLTIQGERRHEKREDHARFHRLERSYGGFTRSFSLPDDCDVSGLNASCHDGQLCITVPRKTAQAVPQPVQVPVS